MKSRIGREIYALFAGIAGLPLLVVGLVGMLEINRALDRQNSSYLADVAQNYGRALFERLELARALVSETDTARLSSRFAAQLLDTAFVDNAGLVHSTGRQPDAALVELARSTRAAALTFETTPGGGSSAILLLPRDEGTAIAFVAPGFLWGEPSDFPNGVDFCVIASGSADPIFCSAELPAAVLAELRTDIARQDVFDWASGNTNMKSSYWELFTRSVFEGPLLRIVASQPTAIYEAPWQALRSVYLPAIFATLGLVLLVAGLYVRRILNPIENLRETTRKLAQGDFTARATIDRHDEFGELARATNAMAEDLNRQFETLRMFGDTDRLILTGSQIHSIIEVILERVTDATSCTAALIVKLDPDSQDSAILHCKAPDADSIRVERSGTEPSALEKLRALSFGMHRTAIDDLPGRWFLEEYDSAEAYVWPVFSGGDIRAALIVGAARFMPLPTEDLDQLAKLVDRLAVGLELTRREQELIHRATYDSLTGLPNRQLLLDRLEQALLRARRENSGVSVCFIDLDRFKQVNDSYGHAFGDELLCFAAERLQQCIRETDTLARLGGDEFVILMPGTEDCSEPSRISHQALEALSAPFQIESKEIYVSASIGVARYPQDGTTAESLLRKADTAMYGAKSAGRGQALDFTARMENLVKHRLELESDMHRALERGEFRIVYQPQFRLTDDRLVAAEALLRWDHPTRGEIQPQDFISVAEDSGLIKILGSWVLSNACRQMKQWRNENIAIERVAVNVSLQQFMHRDFVAQVADCLRATAIPPEWVELELTESAFILDVDQAMERLQQIRALGVAIAIDDFGTGYSSLSYVKDLPIDVVKIDRSFITDLPHDRDACAIVSAITLMALTLDKQIVAEGIETQVQLQYLRELGVTLGQGNLLGRPLAAQALARHVAQTHTRARSGGSVA